MAKQPKSHPSSPLAQEIADNERRIELNEYLLMTLHNARKQLLLRRQDLLSLPLTKLLADIRKTTNRPVHSKNCPHSPAFRPPAA
jgi:hypothetical protein